MGVVQLPDELQRVIERQVAEGRAVSPAAFLEEAVRRLVDETRGEEDAILTTVAAGSADIEAGRFTSVTTADDEQRAWDGMMERLQARFGDGD